LPLATSVTKLGRLILPTPSTTERGTRRPHRPITHLPKLMSR